MVVAELGPEADLGPNSVGLARPRASSGLAAVVLGLVAVAVVLAVMVDVTAVVRVPLMLGGLGLTYWGVDRLAKRWRGPRFETGLWLSLLWLVLVVGCAAIADSLPLAEARDASKTFEEPILARPDLLSAHPLGTDRFGLDLLGGVVHGARLSLQISFGAVALGLVIGGLGGVAAGYFRGLLDSAAGVLTDAMLAVPPLIFLIALMVALDPNVSNLVVALAIIGIPAYYRLARANTLSLAHRDFVTAAKAMGATHSRIISRELVPNVALPLLSYASIIVAVLIVAEGSLSFLGLSIPRPEPTWGNMVAGGQEELRTDPHLVMVPATVMFLTVFALNRVGDKARDLWGTRDAQL